MKDITRVLSRADRRSTEEAADAARRRFVAAAGRSLDLAYAMVASPVGPLVVACTQRGLALISYRHDELDAVLAELAARISPRILEAPDRLDAVRRQLDEYFGGRRRRFEVPLDWTLAPAGFGRRVLRATARVPFGEVASYRAVAVRAGSPGAVRAAGNALGANPIPIVVPCHRVLRSDGSLGGYGGGLARKRFLLDLEREPGARGSEVG
jgi:methylated-DNA-[protein]-cysteine S-methyltransferase